MKSTPTWTQRLGLHAHTHTHNHTHTHKHLCICIFTDKLALFPSQVNKHTTSHTCACQRTYPQIFLTCMPIASQMHTQACMDTFLCRHTHTHTHTQTHTCFQNNETSSTRQPLASLYVGQAMQSCIDFFGCVSDCAPPC